MDQFTYTNNQRLTMKNENKQPEDYYHGIYEYCGDEFDDSVGEKIHVWDDHSNPDAPCYKIQFVGSNEIHDNMDDSDIDWSEKHFLPEGKDVESGPVKSAEEIDHYKGEDYYAQYTGELLDLFYHRFYEQYSGKASGHDKKQAFYEWLNEQNKNTTY